MERCFSSLWGRGDHGPERPPPADSDSLWRIFLRTARTYLATAVKAKSTLRPVLALVSMKGSPYSCKQLLPARWQPGGDSPGPAPPGTLPSRPPHPGSP